MIVTLTANPSLDRTISLAEPLEVGEVQSALGLREDAGGKGINVARVVAAAGHPTLAVLPLLADDPFAVALRATGVPAAAVPIAALARANVTIADAHGVTTKLNLPGAGLTPSEAGALIEATVSASLGADWLVLAGSLPPGVPDDFYRRIIDAVRSRAGASAPLIAVDSSGAALREAVESGHPDLIKPNDEELVELAGAGSGTDTVEAVAELARTLVPSKVGAAFVTLGGRGAVLVTADGAWCGTPPPTQVRSTVGAGDASLAGFLLARTAGGSPAQCVEGGIRYGAAAAALEGTQAPRPSDLSIADVPVRQIGSQP